MSDVDVTINGKPLTEQNIKNVVDQMVFEAVVEGAKKQIMSVLSDDEASKVTINVVGTDIENLTLEFKGPDDVILKINKATKQY